MINSLSQFYAGIFFSRPIINLHPTSGLSGANDCPKIFTEDSRKMKTEQAADDTSEPSPPKL